MTRSLEVAAPQLEKPIPITVEVTTRRHPVYLLVMLALGLFAGWLLRTELDRRIKLGTAKTEALALADRLRKEGSQHVDRRFVKAVNDSLRDLEDLKKSGWGTTAHVAKITTDTLDRLDREKTSLTTRRKETKDSLEKLLGVVRADWQVPAVIRAKVVAERKPADKAGTLLASDKVTDAQELVEGILGRLSGLAGVGEEWRKEILPALVALALLDVPPNPLWVELRAAAERARDAVIGWSVGEPRDPGHILDSLNRAYAPVAVLVSGYVKPLREEAAAVLEILQDAGGDKAEGATELAEAIERLRTGAEDADTTEAAVQVLAAEARPLLQALKHAVRAQISPDLDEEFRLGLERLVKAGDFRQAADELRGTGLGTEPGFETSPSVKAAPPATPTGPPAVQPVQVTTAAGIVLDWLEEERSRVTAALRGARRLQTALVVIGLVLFGYALFVGSFTGTMPNLIQVLLWAFALDITVDRLVEAAKGPGPGP